MNVVLKLYLINIISHWSIHILKLLLFFFYSYQKTESVVKTTAEKATTIFGGFGTGLTTKLGQIKNSESFRSFEEKVGSALENVKVQN